VKYETVKAVIIFKGRYLLCEISCGEISFPAAPTFIMELETSSEYRFFF